jgi:hypothetical protein
MIMKNLKAGKGVTAQLWPKGSVHAFNISDTVVFGDESENKKGVNQSRLPGVPKYKLRFQGALQGKDIHIVPEKMVEQARKLALYHAEVGLQTITPDRIIGCPLTTTRLSTSIIQNIDTVRKRIEELSDNLECLTFVPFIASEHSAKIAELLKMSHDCDPEASSIANNKATSLAEIGEFGVVVPPGETVFTEKDARRVYKQLSQNGNVWGKLACAASGQGVKEFESSDQFEEWIKDPIVQLQLSTEGKGIRLDEDVDNVPNTMKTNVLMWVGNTPEEDAILNMSYQELKKANPTDKKGTVHCGNFSPTAPDHEKVMRGESQKVANYHRARGARGYCGVDFIIRPDKEEPQIFYFETNFRQNGNSGAASVAHNLGYENWAYVDASVPKGTDLNSYRTYLQQSGLEWNAEKGDGILVLNPAKGPEFGLMQVAVLVRGTGEDCRKKVMELMEKAAITKMAAVA